MISSKWLGVEPRALRAGGGFAIVILGLARGESKVGGMGAVWGLEIKSSASWKGELDIFGMEGEKLLRLWFTLGGLGEEK